MAAATSSASSILSNSNEFLDLKEAYATASVPLSLVKFNIGTILSFFIDARADFKAIRANSYELFTSGHVRTIEIKNDEAAKKLLIRAECLAQMKQKVYQLIIILSEVGDINHANCGCPAGAGPLCSCKHVAALAYALDDFSKTFIQPEDLPSCTDKLEAWNKPRDVKLPAVPIYDVNFERRRHGKETKERRELCGHAPSAYQLDSVCPSDHTAATTFLKELKQWSEDSGKPLLINTVASDSNAIETTSSVCQLSQYMVNFREQLHEVSMSDDSATQLLMLKECLKVNDSAHKLVQDSTILQSLNSDWFQLRKVRITGSVVSRVCNFIKFHRSDPGKIANAIVHPSQFSSASMLFGVEHEQDVLDRYLQEKTESNITLKKLGLVIDPEHGYLAASSDSAIVDNDNIVGIIECKTTTKWSQVTVEKAMQDKSYPLQCAGGRVRLKENHTWFHQIQLQFYVCREFAKY